jgi:hypothetical protein
MLLPSAAAAKLLPYQQRRQRNRRVTLGNENATGDGELTGLNIYCRQSEDKDTRSGRVKPIMKRVCQSGVCSEADVSEDSRHFTILNDWETSGRIKLDAQTLTDRFITVTSRFSTVYFPIG